MIRKNIRRLVFVVLAVLIIVSVVFAFAANISVPVTRLTDQARAITANTLKPAACSGFTVTTIVYCPAGGGVCSGTSASELILGSPNVDTIQGKGGADCIVGGGGDDDITGDQGNNVCIGGPGNDTFKKCQTAIQ
jgi:Ca2+-binding RTX toxin-like protein